MPLPIWLAGLVVGGLAHQSAKDKNATAQRTNMQAKSRYDNAVNSFNTTREKTLNQMNLLKNRKREVLKTSIARFIKSYQKIKHLQIQSSAGMDELNHFQITQKDMLILQDLEQNIYQSAGENALLGIAVGTGAAALAGGSGAVAAAESVALGGLLAPIAAGAVLFTGISASLEADENLQKANANYAKADREAEKLRTAQVKLEAITERTNILDSLLNQLNEKFAYCVGLSDAVIARKTRWKRREQVTTSMFTEDEIKLIAVTRALAGAVKSIIDTPICYDNGELTDESEQKITELKNTLPQFSTQVSSIRAHQESFNVKPRKVREIKLNTKDMIVNGLSQKERLIRKMTKIFQAGILLVLFFILMFYALYFVTLPYHILLPFLMGGIAFFLTSYSGIEENFPNLRKYLIYPIMSAILVFCLSFIGFNLICWFLGSRHISRIVGGFIYFAGAFHILFEKCEDSKDKEFDKRFEKIFDIILVTIFVFGILFPAKAEPLISSSFSFDSSCTIVSPLDKWNENDITEICVIDTSDLSL